MARKELLLHVGMDKTGTTAIQAFFHQNRKRLLREDGLCYPKTGQWRDHSHHPFAFSIFEQNGFTADSLPALFESLAKESHGAKRVLLSSECLFKGPTKEGFDAFHRMCLKYFSKIKVLVYVRPQDAWVESRYKHSVLSGGEIPLEKLTTPFFCHYHRYMDLWSDVVGLGNVQVRPFEKSQFVGGDIFADFLNALGLKVNSRHSKPAANLNVSLRLDGVAFKRLCNSIGFLDKSVHQLNSLLIQHAGMSSGQRKPERLLSPAARKSLLHSCAESNQVIAEKYLGRHDSGLFLATTHFQEEEWGAYPGLTGAALLEIRDFLQERSPGLVRQLKKVILKARDSNDEASVAAANSLCQVFLGKHT